MDMQSIKVLELVVIVGVIGWFYLRQRRSLDQLKQQREAKRQREAADSEGPPAGGAG